MDYICHRPDTIRRPRSRRAHPITPQDIITVDARDLVSVAKGEAQEITTPEELLRQALLTTMARRRRGTRLN